MLEKIANQIYTLVLVLGLVILILFQFDLEVLNVNQNIMFLYYGLTLVTLEALFQIIRKDSTFYNIPKDWIFKISTIGIGVLIIYFLGNISFDKLAIITYGLFALFFRVDERASFSIALYLLLNCVIALLFDFKNIAEILSINTYYFLVLGGLGTIINRKLQNKGHSNNNIENKFKENAKNLFFIIFILYNLVFFIAYNNFNNLLIPILVLLYTSYILFGIFGNIWDFPFKNILLGTFSEENKKDLQ